MRGIGAWIESHHFKVNFFSFLRSQPKGRFTKKVKSKTARSFIGVHYTKNLRKIKEFLVQSRLKVINYL